LISSRIGKELATEGLPTGFQALDLTDQKELVCGYILSAIGVETIAVENPVRSLSREMPPWEKYPELRRELQGVNLIGVFMAAPLRLMTVKSVKSLADLKGMRIKIRQEVLSTLKTSGAEGVIIPMAETYESLQKRIIQGAFGATEAYKSMKVAEVIKYETYLLTCIGTIPYYIMSLTSWNKLPPDIQKIFEASKDWFDQETINEGIKKDNEGSDTAKKAGVQTVQFPPI
jgi:TRAP-type C4-dicarboxylate transport system substrate-binding protein